MRRKQFMKKIYQIPEIEIIKVEIQPMMAGSTLSYGESVSDASGAESRGGGGWNDDWEDEEDEW